MIRYFDCHNHLQDDRLRFQAEEILKALRQENVAALVVNGTREADWPRVASLAGLAKLPKIVPSFGLHPWHVRHRSREWQKKLLAFLNQQRCGVGEIGLDRWTQDSNPQQQEEVFLWQWRLAAERNLPVSVHCLRAWGRLLELLRNERRPECGFLLHSYGGSREMIGPLAHLGAYFSISGYFAHDRKTRQQEVFRHVPLDRLLIETDAPDMLPPENLLRCRLPTSGAEEQEPNHPANLIHIYEFTARLRGVPLSKLAEIVEANFRKLFGGITGGKEQSS
jgi:TatD DNase family protein